MNLAFPIALLITAAAAAQPLPSPGVAPSPRQRVIVLTDIENEPDDTQSLVRLLLYANDIDIRGLVATTSTHLRNRVASEAIHACIDAYAQVLPNLRLHSARYPAADSLHAMVGSGLPRYGMNGVGEGRDSEGSEMIIHELLRSDHQRPLWIAAWGGTFVLAQALWRLRTTLKADSLQQLLARLRVYAIADQDDSGAWIRREFPSLHYITSGPIYDNGAWCHMSENSEECENGLFSQQWLADNIQQSHGALGLMYPDTAYGTEGDSPSFLGLIPNGLNHMEHPDWGGWGGRFTLDIPVYEAAKEGSFGVPNHPESRPVWHEAVDTLVDAQGNRHFGIPLSVQRWRGDFQRDFAARILWCTEDYAHANHNPEIKDIKMYTAPQPHAEDTPTPRQIPDFTVHSGEYFRLSASASDPDGDSVSYRWIPYPEISAPQEALKALCSPVMHEMVYQAPIVTGPTFYHIILNLNDKGTPQLTTYCRVIIKVLP